MLKLVNLSIFPYDLDFDPITFTYCILSMSGVQKLHLFDSECQLDQLTLIAMKCSE